jgi:ribosomal protein S21
LEKKTEKKEALRKLKRKDDDKSRLEYWKNRKAYERKITKQEV